MFTTVVPMYGPLPAVAPIYELGLFGTGFDGGGGLGMSAFTIGNTGRLPRRDGVGLTFGADGFFLGSG